MGALQNKLATTQAQLAASKQILAPSDSPDQAAAIQRLRGEIDKQANNKTNMQVAMRHFSVEESALKSSSDILIRIKELAIQAANDTLAPDDRKAIGVEMKALRDQLLSLGNSRDDNGNYLFSGFQAGTTPYVKTNTGATFQGDAEKLRVVFDNLLSNAIKFSPENSEIHLHHISKKEAKKYQQFLQTFFYPFFTTVQGVFD